MSYRGITYPAPLDHAWVRRLWRRWLCPREIHLFDEVESDERYLYCDACGRVVYVKGEDLP